MQVSNGTHRRAVSVSSLENEVYLAWALTSTIPGYMGIILKTKVQNSPGSLFAIRREVRDSWRVGDRPPSPPRDGVFGKLYQCRFSPLSSVTSTL